MNVKAVGAFLLSLGGLIEPGSVAAARKKLVAIRSGEQVPAASVGVALALYGYQIIEGSLSLYRRAQAKQKR